MSALFESTEAGVRPGSYRLQAVRVRNFLRITDLEIEPHGNHVVATGPNGSGKTSLLNAIWHGVLGITKRQFPQAVKQGADEARIDLDFGAFRIVRHFTDDGRTSLDVSDADGKTIGTQPQKFLNGLWAKLVKVDPVAFLQGRPQDQVDAVQAACEIEPPVAALEALLGEACPALPGESASAYLTRWSADQTGEIYRRRRDAHRAAETKRAALEEQRGTLQALGGPPSPDEEPPSAAELLAQAERLTQVADERRKLQDAAAQAYHQHADALGKLKQLEIQLAQLVKMNLELEAKLREGRELEKAVAARIGKGQKVVADLLADRNGADEFVKAVDDPGPQLKLIRQQIAAVEGQRIDWSKRKVLAGQLETLAKDFEEARGRYALLDEVMAKVRDMRLHLLDDVDLGVDGLAIGDGELTLKGVPFCQASQAEQIVAAVAIATRQPSPVKMMRIDSLEHLVGRNRTLLFELADKAGWQLVAAVAADTAEMNVNVLAAAA